MQSPIHLVRLRAGMMLLRWALLILPPSPERTGILRGLNEQSQYERYLGYCQILAPALPFVRWREQWRWQRRKLGGAA
jgi:hypothetical protein